VLQEVAAAPPAAAAPALPALQERLGNLMQAETLLGREADLIAVPAMVREHRLVSLLGAGGIGKTSLARAAARQLVDPWRGRRRGSSWTTFPMASGWWPWPT
jgi:hypothetical protein